MDWSTGTSSRRRKRHSREPPRHGVGVCSLAIVERTRGIGHDELVEIAGRLAMCVRPNARPRRRPGGGAGPNRHTRPRPGAHDGANASARLGVGLDLLGQTLDGSGHPRDGRRPPPPDELVDLNGRPMNPGRPRSAAEFIERAGFHADRASPRRKHACRRPHPAPVCAKRGPPAHGFPIAARMDGNTHTVPTGAWHA